MNTNDQPISLSARQGKAMMMKASTTDTIDDIFLSSPFLDPSTSDDDDDDDNNNDMLSLDGSTTSVATTGMISTMAFQDGKNNVISRRRPASSTTSGMLPKCVCNWKNCRTYQKAYRNMDHPIFNGVVEMKFHQGDTASTLLKSSVERTLRVPKANRLDWKNNNTQPTKERGQGGGGGATMIVYEVARHHFTEQHIVKFLEEEETNLRETAGTVNSCGKYQWTSLFTEAEAKQCLFALDPKETIAMMRRNDDIDGIDHDGSADSEVKYYLQCPNVSKDHAKKEFLKIKKDHKNQKKKKEKKACTAMEPTPREEDHTEDPKEKNNQEQKVSFSLMAEEELVFQHRQQQEGDQSSSSSRGFGARETAGKGSTTMKNIFAPVAVVDASSDKDPPTSICCTLEEEELVEELVEGVANQYLEEEEDDCDSDDDETNGSWCCCCFLFKKKMGDCGLFLKQEDEEEDDDDEAPLLGRGSSHAKVGEDFWLVSFNKTVWTVDKNNGDDDDDGVKDDDSTNLCYCLLEDKIP